MSTLEIDDKSLQIADVSIDDQALRLSLKDGRQLSMPLHWSPRLHSLTPRQRREWRILPFGDVLEWEELDEHISVKGLLSGGKPNGQQSGDEV